METEIKKLIVLAEKYKEYSILAKFIENEILFFSKIAVYRVRIFIQEGVYVVLMRNVRIRFKDADDIFGDEDDITFPFGITTKELKETYAMATQLLDSLPDARGVGKTNEILLAL